MRDERAAGPLHTLDTVERPFYIPRTHAQQHSNTSAAGNRSQRRTPASPNGAFPRVIARFPRVSSTVHPFPQEVPANDPSARQCRAVPDRVRPRTPLLGGRLVHPAAWDAFFAFVPQPSEPNLGGPPWTAGTQEDEE